METTIVYFILISSLSFVLIQALVSMNYFKRFAFEYLSNEPISWNPNHDRSAFAFSSIFGLYSIYLMREIWHGKTENSWFLTIIYLVLIIMFTFFIIIFIREIDKKKRLLIDNVNKRINSSATVIVEVNSIERDRIKESFLFIIYTEFKRFDLLDDDFNIDEFENNPPKLNITNADFYLLHKIYIQKYKSKVSLKEFCTRFKNKNGELFNYGAVRKDGINNPNSSSRELINNIFKEK